MSNIDMLIFRQYAGSRVTISQYDERKIATCKTGFDLPVVSSAEKVDGEKECSPQKEEGTINLRDL
jgi:hypothetical protein